ERKVIQIKQHCKPLLPRALQLFLANLIINPAGQTLPSKPQTQPPLPRQDVHRTLRPPPQALQEQGPR
ncbi:uncharacterized protein B0I36DRAFT_389275, partial [Microdochium trichocladiopsis]